MKSRHEAFDDAIHATRAAIAEGVVPGAGLTLLRAVPALEAGVAGRGGRACGRSHSATRSRDAGAADCGKLRCRWRSGRRRDTGTGNFGFDAAAGKYVDLVEAEIIDPTKVVRLGLENAVSVAGVLLLTEATMTEVPEPKADVPSPAGEAF